MKAILHRRYGSPDDLQLGDLDLPSLADDEVLVRVRAAGVNRGDVLAIEGIPYAARLSYGFFRPKRAVPGTDVAGTVEAVGRGVSTFSPGDDVFGWASGAYAMYATASQDLLATKPDHITFEQAAAVPTAGVAALQGLSGSGGIEPGQHVLVVGASGGIGTFAVQIAKAHGCEVTGVCGPGTHDLVRSAGADHIIDYTRERFANRVSEFDVILDMVGNESLLAGRRALRNGGMYIVVGGGNPRSITGMGRFVRAAALSPFVAQRLRPLFSKPKKEDLLTLSGHLGNGKVLPVIDSVYDLHDTPAALAHIQAGHARGKVIVTV